VDVPVAADAGAFLDALAAELEGFEPARNREWLARCKAWQRAYPVVLPEFREQEGGVNTYVLIDALSEVMTADDVLVPGSSGSASELPMQAFRVRSGQRVFSTNGLGAMGFGIPAAVGACVAGGRRTICVDGDGSFPMNLQELEVVRRLALPIKFFVLDNRGYDSIRASQTTHFSGRLVAADPSSGLTLPDPAAVAAAFGIAHRRIDSSADINDRVRDVLEAPGPVICTVAVSPETSTQPRLSSVARADGTMVSRPLEDLWPFLDRQELAENLLIPPVGED
jgi:acetolactate synthase-1/2/3 large subunit